jgi:hypothetical protein
MKTFVAEEFEKERRKEELKEKGVTPDVIGRREHVEVEHQPQQSEFRG